MKDYTKYTPVRKPSAGGQVLTECRDCGSSVSRNAKLCPACGAPYPYKAGWDGYGFEYKSPIRIFGLPLLHISFKYRNRRAVPAVGIISVGQIGLGVFNISQFGIGLFSVHQFGIAGISISQFTVSCIGISQLGIFLFNGIGQKVIELMPTYLSGLLQ